MDQRRLANPQRFTALEFQFLTLIDGHSDLRALHQKLSMNGNGVFVPFERIQAFVQRLDEGLFLDSPRFQELLTGPERAPSCIGCYDANPVIMREQLARLFTAPGGPGLPGEPGCRLSEGRLRAALLPHIDFGRGGVTYGWGFKEVLERTDARLFVIIATSHYSPERFTLTRKNFRSPLGTVQTDQAYINSIVGHYGKGVFNDPIAHLPEHSVELEVVMLQYLYEGKRDFRIVPLVVGSYMDCVAEGVNPP